MPENGKLQITSPYEITDLRVLDAWQREVATGTHALDVELKPGIYRVMAQVPGDHAEQLVAVKPGKTLRVEAEDLQLEFDSAVPFDEARSSHEYQAGPAKSISTQTHVTVGTNPQARLFLFARTTGDSRDATPSFHLRNRAGKTLASFPEAGEKNLQYGWLALSVDLPAGTYMLEQDVPGLGKRAQAVFVEDGWETQLFIPWRDKLAFVSATVHMHHKGSGFNPHEGWQYTRIEAALHGLAEHKLTLHPGEIDAFLHGKFDNPMLGLIGAYALLNQQPVPYDYLDAVSQNLMGLLPNSPDAKLLALLAQTKGEFPPVESQKDLPTFSEPPFFAVGTEHLMGMASRIKKLCPPDSWLAHISLSLVSDGAWTRWEADISKPKAVVRLQTEVESLLRENRKKLKEFANRVAENTLFKIFIPKSVRTNILVNLLEGGNDGVINILEKFGINANFVISVYAHRIALELAPKFVLPLSVVAATVKAILKESISNARKTIAKKRKIAAVTAKSGKTPLTKKKAIAKQVRKKMKKHPATKGKTASKKIVTHTALSTKIETSLAGLNAALSDSTKAVNAGIKEAKKLAIDTARLRKKRMTLMKRKKAAANRLRKDKNAINRKALNAVVKEIAGIAKLFNKATVAKDTVAAELSGLKADQRRLVAYVKALGQADKALNTPKKRPSRKMAEAVHNSV